MKQRSQYDDTTLYTTRDGSHIRELMHPQVHGNSLQSLAEATIAPGKETLLHKHMLSEELYHITQGESLMTLANESFIARTGDTICIPPGTAHKIKNTGTLPLKILCCCAPAYAHADTLLIEQT
jgi:mannose-6-phosphate isomerase-like protein (cupin superfamily)